MLNKHSRKRIIFLGTPDFAVASLEKLLLENYTIVAVVTAPDKPAGRGQTIQYSDVKKCALSHGIPVLQPVSLKNPEFIEELRSYQADLQVVVAFRMLPEVVWNMPPLGTINVHGSLLPKYRGAAPINWAIIRGEKQTGVTTFLLKHQIDTGDILLNKVVPILASDNFGTMYEKLKHAGAELLHDTLQKYFSGDVQPTYQDDSESTHAPKIFKETCILDFHNEVEDVHNLIRGLAPRPTAFTYLKEKVFKIYESDFAIEEHHLNPGEIITDQKTFLKFACKNGYLIAKNVQLEGKKAMKIEEFLRGYKW